MTRYATDTSVSVDRSRAEIEKLLQRFGAESFGYAWDRGQESVGFVFQGKQVRLAMPLPKRESYRSEEAWAKERRRRLRVLVMALRALLVAVDDGLIGFEEAFLSWFVTPSGRTVGDELIPRLEAAAHRGELPLLLPAHGGDG